MLSGCPALLLSGMGAAATTGAAVTSSSMGVAAAGGAVGMMSVPSGGGGCTGGIIGGIKDGIAAGIESGDTTLALLKTGLCKLKWNVNLNLNPNANLNASENSEALQAIGHYKATRMIKGYEVGVSFNFGGETIVELKGLTLAGIEIPFSQEGIIPALDNALKNRLEQKGVSEQTITIVGETLHTMLSVIQTLTLTKNSTE